MQLEGKISIFIDVLISQGLVIYTLEDSLFSVVVYSVQRNSGKLRSTAFFVIRIISY